MGKKRAAKFVEEKPDIWCFYCDREFDDERVLIQHQKAKHFKCDFCNKKLTTSTGLVIHGLQVHKETITKIPGARPDRESTDVEIFGMAGIPDEYLSEKAKVRKKIEMESVSMGNFLAPPTMPGNYFSGFPQYPGLPPPPPSMNNSAMPPMYYPGPPSFQPNALHQPPPPAMHLAPSLAPPQPPSFPFQVPPLPVAAPVPTTSSFVVPTQSQLQPTNTNTMSYQLPLQPPPFPIPQPKPVVNTVVSEPVNAPAPPTIPPNTADFTLIWTDEEFSMEERRAQLPKYKTRIHAY
eukprot:gene16931-22423_t